MGKLRLQLTVRPLGLYELASIDQITSGRAKIYWPSEREISPDSSSRQIAEGFLSALRNRVSKCLLIPLRGICFIKRVYDKCHKLKVSAVTTFVLFTIDNVNWPQPYNSPEHERGEQFIN